MVGGEAHGLTEFVKIEKGLGPDGRIAVVRFDRGDAINALSPEALRQLTRAARTFEDDSETSVVVLTGGAHAFSAGFDLRESRRSLAPHNGYRLIAAPSQTGAAADPSLA